MAYPDKKRVRPVQIKRGKETLMPVTADCHLHSSYSGDSREPMENLIRAALDRGLTHICLTEHMDMDFPVSEDTPADLFTLNTDAFLYDLALRKAEYADRIKILFGVELGLQPHLQKELALYAREYEFDFIIGSVHVVNGRDPYYPAYYEGRDDEEAYREYFQAVIDNLKRSSCFDVCGHLDYVVRYGRHKDRDYSYEKYRDLFDTMLELILEKEKGIELNTGSLRKGLSQASPHIDVLRRYRELGGEIVTVGSDAHRAEDVAADFDRAAELLKECGFRYYCVFEKRIPEFHKI